MGLLFGAEKTGDVGEDHLRGRHVKQGQQRGGDEADADASYFLIQCRQFKHTISESQSKSKRYIFV
jgi:hypothetical protein